MDKMTIENITEEEVYDKYGAESVCFKHYYKHIITYANDDLRVAVKLQPGDIYAFEIMVGEFVSLASLLDSGELFYLRTKDGYFELQ